MKRYIALTLSIIMVLVLAIGCTNSASNTNGNTTAPSGSSEASPAASDNSGSSSSGKPVTITLFTVESDTQWKLAETPNFKAIQKIFLDKFNIDYQLETALSKEYETTITTLFASGNKLPDIINYGYPSNKLMDLYNNKLILKLNDLIDQYGPDVKALLKIRPYVVVANGDRDGNILRIPAQIMENPQHRITVASIRNDWLTKVGKKVPTTPDEYYQVLKAFQDQDVNGSGKKDEILTCYDINSLNKVFSTAFGVKLMINASDSWYADDQGKIYNTMLKPEVKDYLTFMNKLYSEKLLDNDFMNQTSDQYNQKEYSNQIASEVGAWWDSVLFNTAVRDKGFKDCDLIPMMPPISNTGKPIVYVKDLPGYDGYMITKDCTDPKAAMETINWGYTLEGGQMNYYGETGEGGDYYKKATALEGLKLPDWQMEYTDKGKAEAAKEPLLWQKMGWNTEFTTKNFIAGADAVAQEFGTSFTNAGTAHDVQFNLKGLNDAVNTYGIPAVNFVAPTTEQTTQWEGFSDLWTYMDEMISKFVTGAAPLTDWDKFVAQCDSMGIKDATAIKQDQYDAYVKIMQNQK